MGQQDWSGDFQSIQDAFERVAKGLDPQGMQRLEALKFLVEWHNVLKAASACLKKVSEVEKKAKPGPTLKDAIEQKQEAILREAQELAQLRQEIESLAQMEAEWQSKAAEKKKLERRYEELQRLAALADAGGLEELCQQVETLEQRRELLEVEKLEQNLEQGAQALVRLSEGCLSRLKENVRQLLELAQTQEGKRSECEKQLRRVRERYRQALEKWRKCHGELERYVEADWRIAKALPDSQEKIDALDALDKVKELIRKADEALKIAIENNEKQQRREQLFYSARGGN
jgi:chromosome segregation ATPase